MTPNFDEEHLNGFRAMVAPYRSEVEEIKAVLESGQTYEAEPEIAFAYALDLLISEALRLRAGIRKLADASLSAQERLHEAEALLSPQQRGPTAVAWTPVEEPITDSEQAILDANDGTYVEWSDLKRTLQ